MALNNLRIIYQNLADSATLTAPTNTPVGTPVGNLQKDAKGSVWRTPTTTAGSTNNSNPTAGYSIDALIQVDLGSTQSIHSVVLPFTNLNSAFATIQVIGYSVAPTNIALSVSGEAIITGGTQVTNFSQTSTCCPWNTLGLSTGSPNTYAYGGGTYARIWLSSTIQALSARYLVIKITDYYSSTAVTLGKYIEASRLIIGRYWTPVYNTGYGMTATIKDLSAHDRTESGDLVTQRGPRFNSLSFDLAYLSPTDRIQMTKLLLGNGISKPLFVSLFPDNGSTTNDYEMERAHQIYGKLMQTPGISYHTLDMYSSQIELEEV
jgi:hypothetical protein